MDLICRCMFCFRWDNDLWLGLCIEEVVQVQDGDVHPSRAKDEGCDWEVGVGLYGCGVSGYWWRLV